MSERCPKCGRNMLPGTPGEMACLTCGKRVYEAWPAERKPTRTIQELNGADQYQDCEVCNTRMRVSTNRPYCSLCETKLRRWRNGPQTGPAPIIQVNGKWMRNPEWLGKKNPRGPSHNMSAAA